MKRPTPEQARKVLDACGYYHAAVGRMAGLTDAEIENDVRLVLRKAHLPTDYSTITAPHLLALVTLTGERARALLGGRN